MTQLLSFYFVTRTYRIRASLITDLHRYAGGRISLCGYERVMLVRISSLITVVVKGKGVKGV